MKIVMLTDIYDERMQYQDNLFAKYYVKHGHEVTILASTIDNTFDYYAGRERYDRRSPRREYRDGLAHVVKLPYSLRFLSLRKLRGVREVLERERPDLIFSHDVHLNLPDAVWFQSRHPGCRIILDYHADFGNSGRTWLSRLLLHRLTRRPVLQRALPHIDRVFPVVPASADFLNVVYGVPRERMELLPLGADTDHARAVHADGSRNRIRQQLGIPPEATAIFTGGKLTPAKRTHLLLDAIRRISDPSLRVIIAGEIDADQQYRGVLESAAAGLPHVHFTGWLQAADVYRYMAACDLAVFPASQSVLWQQSLSMGLPIIVGHVGVQDPSYMNIHGALTILPESEIRAEAIAVRILELTSDPALLARRREAALRTVAELLNYDHLVDITLRND